MQLHRGEEYLTEYLDGTARVDTYALVDLLFKLKVVARPNYLEISRYAERRTEVAISRAKKKSPIRAQVLFFTVALIVLFSYAYVRTRNVVMDVYRFMKCEEII